MTNAEPSAPQPPKGFGRLVVIGAVLGVVLTPIGVFLGMEIVNQTILGFDGGGGTEDRLGCVLRQVVITAMSIPVGALIGFFMAYWVGSRRGMS